MVWNLLGSQHIAGNHSDSSGQVEPKEERDLHEMRLGEYVYLVIYTGSPPLQIPQTLAVNTV